MRVTKFAKVIVLAGIFVLLSVLPMRVFAIQEVDDETIAYDIRQLRRGDYNTQRAASARLVGYGEAAVPKLLPLLSSEAIRERQLSSNVLLLMGEDVADLALPPLLEAMRVETDGLTLQWLTSAAVELSQDPQPIIEILLMHIAEGGELAEGAAQELFDIEGDLTQAKPVLLEALSARWNDNKCYLAWTLIRKMDLSIQDMAQLARVGLGPKPRDFDDHYGVRRDWEYAVEALSDALRDYPDEYLVFLKNHPGALTVYRENEPWMINLFADTGPETAALCDYLLTRSDLPALFEIDRSLGERVGVVESYPTGGNICFPSPQLITLIVRDGRCDLQNAGVEEGNAIQFGSGLAAITIDGLVGYCDEEGVIRIPPSYEWAGTFQEGMAWFHADGKVGAIDTEGNVLIEPRFDRIYGFNSEYWTVEQDGVFGLVSYRGALFVEPAYTWIQFNFQEQRITAQTPDGATGSIDAEGQFTADE